MTFTNNDWWRDAVIYQIYPRSFSDANGDGNGDLQGVIDRLDYLQALGVDALWLSPFYPSPLADGGYDVADYCDVDPRLGTLDQFDELVAKAHERGIGIIVDIVPNHTSDQHRWFQEALAQGPESEAAQRYVFRQGKGEHGELPPTNWLSNFGGSAWESCGDGWYYLHLFAKEQPDLNWDNPEVRHEFLRVLTFWCDRGVDGFRIDVSHGLAKDLREPLRDRIDPTLMSPQATDGSDPLWDRDAVHDIYREWRDLFNQYTPAKYAVGESWSPFTTRIFQSPSLMNLVPYSTSPCQRPPGIAKNTAPRLSARIAMLSLPKPPPPGCSATTMCHVSPRVSDCRAVQTSSSG